MAYQSKAELVEEAEALGITVDPEWTREELLAAIEQAEPAAGGNLGFPHQPGEAPPA